VSLPEKQAGSAVLEAVAIMARLRGPEGCPWDREQTFDSIMRHTLEETYEVFDAIERRAWPELKDELGDLLLQVLFYAQMAKDAGYFDIEDVAENLNAKLIRRHPHIFGDATAKDSGAVNAAWERIKREEKAARGAGGVRGVGGCAVYGGESGAASEAGPGVCAAGGECEVPGAVRGDGARGGWGGGAGADERGDVGGVVGEGERDAEESW
jgi:NTP pyrophosphatase (non-canonical NTP hydrolase)